MSTLVKEEQPKQFVMLQDEETQLAFRLNIVEMFERQAQETPDAIAIEHEDVAVTYAVLETRSNQVARYLHSQGIGIEDRIAVCLERSIHLITVLLGILKAGGTYVPIDPNIPKDRSAYILGNAKVTTVFTQASLITKLPQGVPNMISWDRVEPLLLTESSDRLSTNLAPSILAYITYTSGSTGVPKGVLIPHQGLSNIADEQQRLLHTGPESRVLFFASITFDASIFEILMALTSGGTLVIPPPEAFQLGHSLIKVLRNQTITHTLFSPSLLASLPYKPLPALEILIVAGEVCPHTVVNLWSNGRRFFNLYGPTEATIWSTSVECQRNSHDDTTIGCPIANTSIYVMDQALQSVGNNRPGEAVIGGRGVASGYINLPALTAQQFVPDPFSPEPGARLYKTGDRVQSREDHHFRFLGRVDHQIKLRGFRIEPGEIEAVLDRHPTVQKSVVLCCEITPDQKQLVAYVLASSGSIPNQPTLRHYLETQLPDYMVPSVVVFLTTFPLTSNGKVDRRALPVPNHTHRAHTNPYVAPRTDCEKFLVNIWQDLLKVQQIGVHDNFLELGGNSLLASQVMEQIRLKWKVRMPLHFLFEQPTVAALVCAIEKVTQSFEFEAGEKYFVHLLEDIHNLTEEEVLGLLESEGPDISNTEDCQ